MKRVNSGFLETILFVSKIIVPLMLGSLFLSVSSVWFLLLGPINWIGLPNTSDTSTSGPKGSNESSMVELSLLFTGLFLLVAAGVRSPKSSIPPIVIPLLVLPYGERSCFRSEGRRIGPTPTLRPRDSRYAGVGDPPLLIHPLPAVTASGDAPPPLAPLLLPLLQLGILDFCIDVDEY
uniref:Uncharacterized protein n=1 Tax=Glossina pallidipes TaxID=7398 RepID=A0A1A9ZTP0_GLOPL